MKANDATNFKSFKSELLKNYQEALNDPDFKKLITKLKLKEEQAMMC